MACNHSYDLVCSIVDKAVNMVDFAIAILGVVRVKKKLTLHNEAVCIDLEDVSMIPECNFRFSLNFDISLFRKQLRETCLRAKHALNELRICRLKRPMELVHSQPVLTDKFKLLTNKITDLSDQIEEETLVDRNEMRDFKEIRVLMSQIHNNVKLVTCNMVHSIRMKETAFFAAPITDVMGLLDTVLIKLDCVGKRAAQTPRCFSQ